MRGQLPDHRRGCGDERQHGAQVCDRTGGSRSDPDGAHHRHHPGRPHHAADLALERQRVERRMAALERKECASGC